jgi:hypothetical protein
MNAIYEEDDLKKNKIMFFDENALFIQSLIEPEYHLIKINAVDEREYDEFENFEREFG